MWKLIHNIDKELFSKLILKPTGKVYFLINEIKCEQGIGRFFFKFLKISRSFAQNLVYQNAYENYVIL